MRVRDAAKAAWESRDRVVGGALYTSRIPLAVILSRDFARSAFVIPHEVTHVLSLSNNHHVTANAMDEYFRSMRNTLCGSNERADMDCYGLLLSRKKLGDGSTVASRIKALYSKPITRFGHKLHTNYEYLNQTQPELEEREITHAANSPASLGEILGGAAAYIEDELVERMGAGKRFSGLFFIREVSKGRPIQEVYDELRAGKHDKELLKFGEKHGPALMRQMGRD